MRALLTGWGYTKSGGSLATSLQHVPLRVVRPRQCREKFSMITGGMICAGGEEGEDTCQSDSGGPLTVPASSGQHVLIGVTSFGIHQAANTYISLTDR